MNKLIVPLKRDKKLSSFLKKEVNKGNKISRDPMIISAYKRDDITIIEMHENKISFSKPSFNTYSASINKIQMCLFGQRNTIPKKLIEEMHSITDFDIVGNTFGESIEKVLWLKTLLDREK